MLLAAIDPHSDAYHAGEQTAPFLLAAVALVVLWTATRSWRRPQPVRIPEDIEDATQLGRLRTRKLLLGSLAIIAAAVAMDVVQEVRSGGDYGSAASKGPTQVTITAPATLGDYRLMTGAAADQLRTQVSAKVPGDHVMNFYTATGDPTHPVLIVLTDTSTVDSRLADDLDQHSADYENTQFMAGARVSDPKVTALGSAAGEMQCGQNTSELLCVWTDSGSQGTIAAGLTSGMSLDELGTLTARFRSGAEH